MDEELKLRAGFMLVLDARAHILGQKNPDFAADEVLKKTLLLLMKKIFPKKSKGNLSINWIAYLGPKLKKNYADVRILEL